MSFVGERSIRVPVSACKRDRDGGIAIDASAYISGLEDIRAKEIGIPLIRPSSDHDAHIEDPNVRQILRRRISKGG